jgi:hypothetical protein
MNMNKHLQEGAFHDMFLSSAQARLTMAAYAVAIVVMLAGTLLTGSTELLMGTLALIMTMLLTSYQINCMVVGSCKTWAWVQAGVGSASILIWLVSLLFVLNKGASWEEGVKRQRVKA